MTSTTLVSLALLAASPSISTPTDTLGSYGAFVIGVTGVDDFSKAAGFTEDAAKDEVTVALRKCDVPVVGSMQEHHGSLPTGSLLVSVFFFGNPTHGALMVSTRQFARLASGQLALPATWEYVQNVEPGEAWREALQRPLAALCAEYKPAQQRWAALQAEEAAKSAPTAKASPPPTPAVPACSSTVRLAPGMSKKEVARILGRPVLSQMAQCGGAPGVKRWLCETVSYPCAYTPTTVVFVQVVFGEGKAQTWNVAPAQE